MVLNQCLKSQENNMDFAYALVLLFETYYELLGTYSDLDYCLQLATQVNGVCIEVNTLQELNNGQG